MAAGTNLTLDYNPIPVDPAESATYYLGDQVGTTQMELSSGGWPIWKGDFAPFGQELDTQLTNNHYKFTGKERDSESGLDYFGARYYASNMGRMMSPDWSAKVMPVPYAKLENPQSLNLYSYVGNNPLSKTDPTGHYEINCGSGVKNCDKQQQKFNDAVTAGLKSKDKSVVAAAKAYGALGEKNGVNVSIVNVVDPKNSNVSGNTSGGLQVTADGTIMQNTQVNIRAC